MTPVETALTLTHLGAVNTADVALGRHQVGDGQHGQVVHRTHVDIHHSVELLQ